MYTVDSVPAVPITRVADFLTVSAIVDFSVVLV